MHVSVIFLKIDVIQFKNQLYFCVVGVSAETICKERKKCTKQRL